MKKSLRKIIAVLLSLIMVFACMSIGSVALSHEGTELTDIRDYDVGFIAHNESETMILVSMMHKNEEYSYLGVTENATEYRIVDFESVIPDDSDYMEIIDYTVNGDTFIFLADLYKYVVTDESPDGTQQGYDLFFDGSLIITTEDFVDFESFPFKVNYNNEDVFNEFERYNELSAFGYVGDTFVYANTDYIITKRTDTIVKGKGVYYTTKDFKSWTVCYTPEIILGTVPCEGGLVLPGVYYLYTFRYTALNNGLIIDVEETILKENYLGGQSESSMLTQTYVTRDFKNYKSFFKADDGIKYYDCEYMTLSSYKDSFFMLKEYSVNNESFFEIVKADYNDSKLTTSHKEKSSAFYNYYQTDDCIYITVNGFDTDSQLCSFGNNLKYTKIFTESSIMIFVGKVINDTFYATYGDTLYTFKNGDSDEYRFCGKPFEGCTLLEWNTVNGELFAIYEKNSAKYIAGEFLKTGDADADGKISSSDALMILQASTGLENLDDRSFSVADIDKDGTLKSSDALAVLQYSTGLITKFV